MTQDIRFMVNPERHFNKSQKIQELRGKSFDEVVDIFKERINGWYFIIGDTILQQPQPRRIHASFGLMIINVIIIDLLSQYEYNLFKSKGEYYGDFLKSHIPEFNNNYRNDYKIKYYHPIKEIYIEDKANTCFKDYSEAFWIGFRCGIVHNAMILPFGRINTEPKDIIDEKTWNDDNGDDRVDLVIHPINLYHRIKDIFDEYITKLKNPVNSNLINDFKDKFERDFGYQPP
jgi:hypothetical protein